MKSQTFGSSYKIIKEKYKLNALSYRILNDGSCTRNYNESQRRILLNYFYNDSIIDGDFDYLEDRNNLYNVDLNVLELDAAINKIGGNKAVDYDEMTMEVIKYIYGLSKYNLYYI